VVRQGADAAQAPRRSTTASAVVRNAMAIDRAAIV